MLRSSLRRTARGGHPYMDYVLLYGRFFGDCRLEIVERLAQAGFEIDFWLPSQQLPGLADVGAALFGIILRQWFIANRALRSRYFQNHLRAFQNSKFVGIADVHRKMFVGFREAHEAVDLVTDVTEAARLIAVAVDGEGFAAQGLLHEIRDDPSVVKLHARSVGIEDADDVRIHVVIAAVGHGHGFGETLGFVVDRPGADRIDVAPVGFLLGMLQRVAVAFGRRRDKIFGTVFEGDVESMKGAERTDFQRGDAVSAVVHRTGGTGKVKDVIDFAHVKGFANIFFDELEARFMIKVCEVGTAAGEEVVDDDHSPAFGEQGVAEMGSKKAGAPGHHRTSWAHASLRFLKTAAGTPSG